MLSVFKVTRSHLINGLLQPQTGQVEVTTAFRLAFLRDDMVSQLEARILFFFSTSEILIEGSLLSLLPPVKRKYTNPPSGEEGP